MAITESRIKAIEDRLDELTQNFIQTQKNQVPITAKVDETSNKVDAITPYEDTKTAYIDDTEVVFFDVPEGALVVSFANGNREYTVTRIGDNLKVEFAPLEEVTTITIKIN